jgi:hypothetical protein
MLFNPITLEVDGSLRNPTVLAAVIFWSAALIGLTAWVVKAWPRRRHRVGLVVLAYLLTPIAQNATACMTYWAHDSRISGVGFWAGPPVWIAPLAGVAAGGIVFWLTHRGLSSNAA